jgi:hypothetical protein
MICTLERTYKTPCSKISPRTYQKNNTTHSGFVENKTCMSITKKIGLLTIVKKHTPSWRIRRIHISSKNTTSIKTLSSRTVT